MNKTKIQIANYPSSFDTLSNESKIKRLETILAKICLLRTARKINDVEIVNNTQLGKLKEQNIQFTIIN